MSFYSGQGCHPEREQLTAQEGGIFEQHHRGQEEIRREYGGEKCVDLRDFTGKWFCDRWDVEKRVV